LFDSAVVVLRNCSSLTQSRVKRVRSIRPIWRDAWARPLCLVGADNQRGADGASTQRRHKAQDIVPCVLIRSASIRSPITF
jgi:hypothetical protein